MEEEKNSSKRSTNYNPPSTLSRLMTFNAEKIREFGPRKWDGTGGMLMISNHPMLINASAKLEASLSYACRV